jgi:hypothetical protein
MSTAGDENPSSPPRSSEPFARPKRKPFGPIASGLVAIILAAILSRGGLLIPAILGVGSWWLYKFWPRKPAPDEGGTRAFLERLEGAPTKEYGIPEASQQGSSPRPLDVFRDVHL